MFENWDIGRILEQHYPQSVDKGPSLPELVKPLYESEGLPDIGEAAKLIGEQMELEELEAITTNQVPGRPKEIRYVDLGRRPTASSTPAQEKTLVLSKAGKQRQQVRLAAAVAYSPSLSPPMKSSGRLPPGRPPLEKMNPRKQIEQSREHPPDIGNGQLMPAEMKNFNLDIIESFLGNASVSEDESDGKEEQLMLRETPFLQAMISDRINNDLASGSKW